jgi:predicted permease
MLRNYFTLALRNFWRHKLLSLINVLGLVIGISSSLVIYLIVQYHFSFDKFHPDLNCIYRVVTDTRFAGEEYHNSGVSAPLYKAVREEATGVEQSAGFFTLYSADIQVPVNGKKESLFFKTEGNIVFADANYFQLFPHRWLSGNMESLQNPFQVVISEKAAKKFFPNTAYNEIIGRQIIYNDSITTSVVGVVNDWSQNSDFTFNQFISLATMKATGLKNNFGLESWGSTNSSSQLFIKLAKGTSVRQIESQLKRLMLKYNTNDNKDQKNTKAWKLQSLPDIHFNGTYGTYSLPVASKTTLYGLTAAAIFILLLGCINFINLTTAQSAQRAKEIGVRKTMGGSKRQLVVQFLSETFLITTFSTAVSVVLTPLVLKWFKDFIPQNLRFDLLHEPHIILFLGALIIVVTFLSGLYPAYVLSAYKPATVLKNQAYTYAGKTRSSWLRKTLTVSQFVIAQVFIMGTVLVSKQMYYSLTTDLGFKKEAILFFSIPFDFNHIPETKHQVLETQLRSMPEIEMFSVGGSPPSSNGWSAGKMVYNDGSTEVQTDVQFKYGDTNYIRLYGIKLLAGRNVRQSDSTTEYLINETYAHLLGFKQSEDAVGKYLSKGDNQKPIVGVMADFYPRSLHDPIKPLAFSCEPRNSYTFHIALKPESHGSNTWQQAISKIEKAYKEVYPKKDFQYSFFDESITRFYKDDQDLSKLLRWATALTIIISCLGLLGLVIYTTNQRTKEIGIRKVLGATVTQIITILSRDFILLVLIAFFIAVPIAWCGMQQWLDNFAYRTSINWWVFVLSGAGMLIMALLTLSLRAIKAATENPVKNLRSE